MSGARFTSAFAADLEGYLAFKQNMGCYGTSRIWYLRQFDAWCAEHGRTVFDQGTVEGWVAARLENPGRYRSWMSYVRDFGRWLQATGHDDACVLSDRWKAPFNPPRPENLVMIGRLYGLTASAARRSATELTGQLDLGAAAGRLVRTYSGGMRRRLDIAASLIAAPPVLFLDEPTTGMDPAGRLALWQLLRRLTDQGASLLLTTQYIEEAERLAATIVIIDRGRVIARGTPDELRAQAGGDRLDLWAPPGQDPRRLAAAVASLGFGESAVDEAAGRVVLPVADGAAVLPAAAGLLAAAGLQVSALSLRRPTLEEAFLALTGHGAGRLRTDTSRADGVAEGRQLTDPGGSTS